MNNYKVLLKDNFKQYSMIIIVTLIVIFFQIATKGILLVPQNLSNIVQQNAYVIILATGMMICILTGGNIDLSVGSVVAFTGAICGVLIIEKHMNIYLVIAICLVVSLLIGMWHGFWIAHFRVPSFIATLSGMLIFRGLTYVVLAGKTYSPYPQSFLRLTTGFLYDFIGRGKTKINIATVVLGIGCTLIIVYLEFRKRNIRKKLGIDPLPVYLLLGKLGLIAFAVNSFMIIVARYKGMPIILIPVVLIIVIYNYFLKNSIPGRYIYAVGGNQRAAELSGINVKKVLFLTYVNMAFLATIAGIVFTARLNAGSPQAGNGFELDAIAACYIGGASAMGGVGTIVGAFIGALVMGILNNGMSILGISMDVQMVIKGLVLLIAVVLDLVDKK